MYSTFLLWNLSTIFYLAVAAFGDSPVKRPGELSLAQIPEIINEVLNVNYTENQVLIAVMGATGSGKTTFINLASGSDLPIGHGLESRTSAIQPAFPFELDGLLVRLLDTPGFDDTSESDTDILRMISTYLSTMYEHGVKLSGVIYMHRISDLRVGGISTRNFDIFRKLCGDDSLKNVLIVTNMWDTVNPQVGLERENELRSEDIFFKPALDKGARLFRHNNTIKSTVTIIRQVIENKPTALRVQQEMVDEKMETNDTSAGRLLNKELIEQAEKHGKEIEELQVKAEAAIQVHDEEVKRELESETLRIQQEVERMQEGATHTAAKFDQERAEMEERMKEMAAAAQREAERADEERRRETEKLQEQLRKIEMERRCYECQLNPHYKCIFDCLAIYLDQRAH